jgi:hypothetical protein
MTNQAPTRCEIRVPRPQHGDLYHEIPDATTLYDKTLRVQVTLEGEVVAEATWHEDVYDLETDGARHEVQQRYWRAGWRSENK